MRTPKRTGWFVAAAAATLVTVWLWPVGRADGPPAPAPRSDVATAAAASPRAGGASPATTAALAPVVQVASEVPPGISSEQWAALQAQLRDRPDGPAELSRLGEYFGWSDALRRFREARLDGTSAADLRPLAQTLDDGLPERLQRSEVTAAEASRIESALLEAIEPDASRRADRLERWSAAHLASPAAVDTRQAEFERRQNELVAAWSAQPATLRNRSELERELEALRQQTFGPGSR